MLRYLTSGESHGKALLVILEGIPAGLRVEVNLLNQQLRRRQQGYGRGKRMQIERDRIEILSGLKNSLTLGSPIGMLIKNRDFSIKKLPQVVCPRPGHADLAGLLKYGFSDIRNVLERASARETATRVAAGIRDVLEAGNWKRLRKELIKYGPGFFGVPGGVQIERTVDAIIAYSKGGVYDRRGRKMFDVKKGDLPQAIFGGVYSTKEGRKYIEKKQGKGKKTKVLQDL